ncbi:hypothetical protein H8A99_32865 [Bradyrhizobium sp. Arg68]|uniref:hypothetical protein n=1 Tax=Bradyrhizobium ivorense TaxID=2511166 RepID=UPI001E583A48|nr:hypothetical protein [Bradyrhizobium ivorense]MCC8941096.1 hypothetical protein [Bradyrhizobium ivorense]
MTIFRCHRPLSADAEIPETLAVQRPSRGVLETTHARGDTAPQSNAPARRQGNGRIQSLIRKTQSGPSRQDHAHQQPKSAMNPSRF